MKAYCTFRRGAAVALVLALAACGGIPQDGGPPIIADGIDRGPVDGQDLSQLRAAIAIDPDGCHTWIIDDGLEGYMSRRHDPRTGLPVCTPIAPPGSIVGDPYASAPHVPDIYR
ncbi:hypothetical protein [Alkalilacustris brevis]|uniref:hypothetical protein n=1 Tax=Alkalilacustris brevis TaxID=2026338 RepID=UPI0012D34BAE|nr:hypothetical protein [Alkalilacustris brevis]